MLTSLLIGSFFYLTSYGGVILNEANLGYSFSQTTVSANEGTCGYVLDTQGVNRLPSAAISLNAAQLLPLQLLSPGVCQQDNYALDNNQMFDWANFYQCVEDNTEVDRLVYTGKKIFYIHYIYIFIYILY